MRAKPTPGPWTAGRLSVMHGYVVKRSYEDEAGRTCTQFVAEVCATAGHEKETKPNAHLIAAALDLYEALEASNKALSAERDAYYDSITNSAGELTDPADGEGLGEYNALIAVNRAALAKAGGEA